MAISSVEGRWQLDEDTTLTPRLRTVYFLESVDDYTIRSSVTVVELTSLPTAAVYPAVPDAKPGDSTPSDRTRAARFASVDKGRT